MTNNGIYYEYSVSAFIAARGTPSPIEGSSGGHIWLGLEDYTNGYNIEYYGFNSGEHRVVGKGAIVTNDNETYLYSAHKIKFPITQEQYSKINEFIYQASILNSKGKVFGGYDIATNSCVDFVFTALRAAGIGAERGYITQDGRMIPMSNIPGLEEIHQHFLNEQGYKDAKTQYWERGA